MESKQFCRIDVFYGINNIRKRNKCISRKVFIMKSTISVIVPIYNCEKYIERCINSICTQTYKNLEIIIINDGSTDNSRNICEKICLRDQRIRLFNIKNNGVSNARNYGIECSTGDYLMFVDADDYIEEYMCERLQKIIETNDIDLVVSKAIVEDDNGNMLRKSYIEKSQIVFWDSNYNFQKEQACFVCWGVLYKRECIGDIRFSSKFFVGEDTLFFYTVLNKCRKYYITKNIFYHYVIYTRSASNGIIDDKKYTEILAWKEIEKLISKNDKALYESLLVAIEYRARLLFRKSYNSSISKEKQDDLIKIIGENRYLCLKYASLSGKIENLMIGVLKDWYPKIIRHFIKS